LTSVEQALVEHVRRGEWLDLAADDEAVDEAAMRSWGDTRTIRASVIRDILRGQLAPDPDPHGLQLRGARVTGRLDLENLSTDVSFALTDCLLEEGILARDARLAWVSLTRCQTEHPAEPPLDAERLTCSTLYLEGARIIGHAGRGAVNLIGARIGGQLTCDGAELRNDSGPALAAYGLQVDQDVFLRGGFTAVGSGGSGAVNLTGAHIGGQLECDGAELRNDSGPALVASRLQADQSMFLRDGFTATGSGEHGAVHLGGAHIGGQLACDGAELRNDSGPALVADALHVDEGMSLTDGFTATGSGERGAVRLRGARIGGELSCRGGELRNDSGPALRVYGLHVDQGMFLTDGFTATGSGDVAVDLRRVRVGGTLYFDPGQLTHTADPHRRIVVDGLTYAGVPELVSVGDWLRLLRDGTPSYAAQPYQQLAAGCRAQGHERQAREILIAQRRDQLARTRTSRPERFWGRVTKITLGYGYQPWRALLFLAGAVALSCLLAVILGAHGALAQTSSTAAPGRPCTVIQQVSVGLDLNLPVGGILARTDCDLARDPASATAAWLTAASWVLRLLAWAFAALFIAGFTGAVRKT
jgi:hypothetical protein